MWPGGGFTKTQLTFFSIYDQYEAWVETSERSKTLDCTLEKIDFKVTLNKGRWIYVSNGSSPALTANTMNISTVDPRIKMLFEEFFPKVQVVANGSAEEKLRTFHNGFEGYSQRLELRFFQNQDFVDKKLAAEKD